MTLKFTEPSDKINPEGFLRFFIYGKTITPVLDNIIEAENNHIIIAHSDDAKILNRPSSKKVIYDQFTDIHDLIDLLDEDKIKAKMIILYNIDRLLKSAEDHIRLTQRSESTTPDSFKSTTWAEWDSAQNIFSNALKDVAANTSIFVSLSEEQNKISNTTGEITYVGPTMNENSKTRIKSIFPEIFRASLINEKGIKVLAYKTEGMAVEARDESQVLNDTETSFTDIVKKIMDM